MEIPSFTTWLQTVTWIEMFLDVRLSRTVALRILAFLDERHVATWLLCYECDVVRSVLALKKGIWMQSALHYAFLSIRAFHPPNNEFRWNLVLESANVGWFLYVERNPYFTWKSNWSLFIVKLAYLKKNGTWHEITYLHFFFFQIFLKSSHLRSSICVKFCEEDICSVLCAESKFVGPSR